jgi:hypothetical protein
MANLPQVIGYGHGEIFTTTLSELDVLLLLPFFYFTPLYISLIYGVFLNKALQILDDTPPTYLVVAYFCTYLLFTNV